MSHSYFSPELSDSYFARILLAIRSMWQRPRFAKSSYSKSLSVVLDVRFASRRVRAGHEDIFARAVPERGRMSNVALGVVLMSERDADIAEIPSTVSRLSPTK